MSADVDFDPATLGGWAEVDTCPNSISIAVGDAVQQLHCEYDPGHEPPCAATVLWTNGQPPQEAEA